MLMQHLSSSFHKLYLQCVHCWVHSLHQNYFMEALGCRGERWSAQLCLGVFLTWHLVWPCWVYSFLSATLYLLFSWHLVLLSVHWSRLLPRHGASGPSLEVVAVFQRGPYSRMVQPQVVVTQGHPCPAVSHPWAAVLHSWPSLGTGEPQPQSPCPCPYSSLYHHPVSVHGLLPQRVAPSHLLLTPCHFWPIHGVGWSSDWNWGIEHWDRIRIRKVRLKPGAKSVRKAE